MTNETTGAFDLDPMEIRVLAVLAEKEALTPDNYPMSVNAIVNGCNQLSSRDPIMQLTDEVVQETLQRLIEKKLASAISQAGARVVKYEHRMRIKWTLEQDKVAVLSILMLRGLQTAGEIRTRTGRLFEFKSVPEVETVLQFLIDKYPPLWPPAGRRASRLRSAGRRRRPGRRWRQQRPRRPAGTGSRRIARRTRGPQGAVRGVSAAVPVGVSVGFP